MESSLPNLNSARCRIRRRIARTLRPQLCFRVGDGTDGDRAVQGTPRNQRPVILPEKQCRRPKHNHSFDDDGRPTIAHFFAQVNLGIISVCAYFNQHTSHRRVGGYMRCDEHDATSALVTKICVASVQWSVARESDVSSFRDTYS